MTQLMPEKKILRRWLGRLGTQGLDRLLQLQEADMGSKGTGKPAEMAQFPQIRELLAEIQAENACLRLKDLAVNGHDLMTLGITGPAIGKTLSALLEQVIDEALPNEKQALLNALKNQ
jgi:tRNA nucleotidyltransferase (CCA-adding enzyme)